MGDDKSFLRGEMRSSVTACQGSVSLDHSQNNEALGRDDEGSYFEIWAKVQLARG